TGAYVNKRIRARSVAVGHISAEGVDPIGKVRRAEIEAEPFDIEHWAKVAVSKVRSRASDEMRGIRGCAVEIGPGIMISAHVDAGSGAPVHVVHARGGCEAATLGGRGPGKVPAIGLYL